MGETVDSGEYNVYSTFQSHEPDFDYLKSLEIEEKINKIRWLPQQNAAHFLLSTNGEITVTPKFSVKDEIKLAKNHYLQETWFIIDVDIRAMHIEEP